MRRPKELITNFVLVRLMLIGRIGIMWKTLFIFFQLLAVYNSRYTVMGRTIKINTTLKLTFFYKFLFRGASETRNGWR